MKFLKILNLLIVLIVTLSCGKNIKTLTVDNQLVSIRNDCFERIAFGAMLPLDKAFRMDDMNQLSRCQELCLKEGEKCQTLAFGIHANRNGTCQLSMEKISPTNAQPVGTIFDPDFDLYARKTNCFDLPSNNNINPPNNNGVTSFNDEPTSQNNGVPPPPYGTVSTSSYDVPNNQKTYSPYPSTVGTTMDDKYSPRPVYTPSDTRFQSTAPANNQFSSNGIYNNINEIDRNRPSTERPTTIYNQTPGNYGNINPTSYATNYPMPNDMSNSNYPGVYAGNVPTVDDRYRPSDVTKQPKPTIHPIYGGSGYGNGFSYGTPENNRIPNVRPLNDRDRPSTYNGAGQTYPGTIYKPTSTSSDNDRNGYSGTNRPLDKDYGSRPDADYDNKRRPDENGYDSSTTRTSPYGYGGQKPQDTASGYGQTRPQDVPSTTPTRLPNGRPSQDNKPQYQPGSEYLSGTTRPQEQQGGYGSTRPQEQPGGYGSTRPQDQPGGYGSIRPQEQPGGYGSTRPQDQPGGYGSNRPQDQPGYSDNAVGFTKPGYTGQTDQSDYGYRREKPQQRPTNYPKGPEQGNHNIKPEGNYNSSNNDKRIETYFNPDEYYQSKWTTKPSYPGGNYGATAGPNEYEHDRYPMVSLNACFRRVLAGKRIAAHWVRKTIACERVEECMRECEYENRFPCEGFNYRLDPSGHGQGDCELIEIPLVEMDLYSNVQTRDPNVLRHSEYDYYERDRNAPSSCRPNCKDCSNGSGKPINNPPLNFRPSDYEKPYYPLEHHPIGPSGSSGYGGNEPDRYRPNTSIDKYRPQQEYDRRPDDYHRFDFSSHSHHEINTNDGYYRPGGDSTGYGGDRIDKYDVIRPGDSFRPASNSWQSIPSGYGQTSYGGDYQFRPIDYIGSINDRSDYFPPANRPGSKYVPYRPIQHIDDRYGSDPPPPPPPHIYLERDRSNYNKPSKIIPYLIGVERDPGSYTSTADQQQNKKSNYWGIRNENRRIDNQIFNYFELGGNRKPSHSPIDNSIYIGTRYGGEKSEYPYGDRHDFSNQWTRRPGPDECSVKSSEGFRLHKNAIRHSYTVPTITECEKLCSGENKFICHTYSYRYSIVGRDNCLLCDRPVNLLDYYVDMEPDRNYDIYSMSDEHNSCRDSGPTISSKIDDNPGRDRTTISVPRNNARNKDCFFRAIDATRFFKSIVRDSMLVRSVGECELECIKSSKFTCRAFAFRYGQRTNGGVIDNCQLSDWPVRDMDKERHLILDPSFDIFERASYGHGCEIQPIVDDKHNKLCYLGYGSAAKLLPPAIKKVISVPTEVECKKECIQFREHTIFKCLSFSFGPSTNNNCEMSDLDQSQLKLNIHYTHVNGRDYWLFAWNPFDWTCRDKVTTIGDGNRVNNDRRMDIFREPGDVTWRHYTVSGKPCRIGSGCDKNLLSGFYSCEIDTGEIGSWDYCCKIDYPCGYSKGFEYPWCFVGDQPEQWRKCSDRYFPNNSTQNNINLQSNKDHHNPQEQRPPRPGGLQSLTDFNTSARLWPVTYLYSDGPPNSTELSNFIDCNKEIC